ncbi:MAG: VCBS repeat-containing protein, partial [Holophagales bacterium]|nr:VCBS repeat-containing protein [Holophagales bacterium]
MSALRRPPAAGATASLVLLGAVALLSPPAVADDDRKPPTELPATTAAAASGPPFLDITSDAGITFVHQSAPEKKYILESMSGGLGVADYDGDGRLDIFFLNSLTVETADEPESAPSALYLQVAPSASGLPRFRDVAVAAGVAHPGWGMGLCGADVDGNGFPDLYITGVGGNRLFLNRGPKKGAGTGVPIFEDATARAKVGAGGWSTGCGFADYDRDGDLDLFVSRYVEIHLDDLPELGKDKTCMYRGVAVQCGPRGLPGTGDLLFRNEGDGTFTEVGKAVGVHDPGEYFGLGVAWLDMDDDGWIDLYVANDATPNFL